MTSLNLLEHVLSLLVMVLGGSAVPNTFEDGILVKWLRCFGPTGIPSPTRSQTISLFCFLLMVGFVVSLNFPWRNRGTHGHTQEMFVAVLLHSTMPTCR